MDYLVDGCKKNDIKAQTELYRQLSPKLFGLCLRYSANYSEAEDHLQETFIIIFEKIKQYSAIGSFEGWCKKIAINQCLQSYRKHLSVELNEKHINNVEEDEDVDFEMPVPKEFLLQAIQELPQKYRLVFNLYVLEDYSHIQIAEALNIGVSGSKSNLSRARKILKNKIEAYLSKQKIAK